MPPVMPSQTMQPDMGTMQTASGMPMVQQVKVMPEKKKDTAGLIKTIVIIIVSLIAVTFIGLFIWMKLEYDYMNENWENEINKAVAKAKDEQFNQDEAVRLENEKYPFKVFSGPVDYGELNFEYPKTWSVYVAKDASKGGDFEAYFNPGQIEPISNTSINALRLQILDKDFESVTAQYQKYLESKDKPMSMESVTVNGTSANLYFGVIPQTDLNGYILLFKIRDKTAVLRTDSVLFKDDFDKLVQTIKFNA